MGLIRGSGSIRPVRVAFAVAPHMDWIRRAVQHSTASWGGLHFVIATADDPGRTRDFAHTSAADVIVALDDADTDRAALTQSAGFRWQGGGPFGPFEPPKAFLSARLLGPEYCLQEAGDVRFRLEWQADDPLGDLFTVWFGEYGDSPYERELRERFDAAARHEVLDKGKPVPVLDTWVLPAPMTALDIEYDGVDVGVGFVVIDPADPADLVMFWNLRALGNHVFPWPIGHEGRVGDAARTWLRAALAAGTVHRAVSGDQKNESLHVNVWPAHHAAPVPPALKGLLDEHGVTAWGGTGVTERPPRSRGAHPLATSYTRAFSLTVPVGESTVAVPLPAVPFRPLHVGQDPERIVAAQISFLRESGLAPGRSFFVPNARVLEPLLGGSANIPETFHRPTREGRAVGIGSDADQVFLRSVPTEAALDAMVNSAGPAWIVSRSPSGRFATQVIDLLGGPRSQAGNQPAVRKVLDVAARAPHGQHLGKLLPEAKRYRGSWPGGIMVNAKVHDAYPRQVVEGLIGRKILRPQLPVECPECATTSYLPPEALATDFTCDMCGHTTPLGLIMAKSKDVTWYYKPASTLTAAGLAETMPIMASINVLLSLLNPLGGTLPYTLGLKLAEGKAWSCEIDFALLANLGGTPLAVIGEVKSYRDSITATDLANMGKVQDRLRAAGFECVIVASTLREQLEPDELAALRTAAQQCPADPLARYTSMKPVLPLVFTAKDLSAPEHTADHPARWRSGDFIGLAEDSCRRNLGLTQVVYTGNNVTSSWSLSWAQQSQNQGGPGGSTPVGGP